MLIDWNAFYDALGIKDFIYFISAPSIQDALFPIKLVFILFAGFFFVAVIYFYINSSYIKYQFLQDVTEFFSWQAYGLREINRRWKRIQARFEAGTEADIKLAIIEADDFLFQTFEDRGFKGETFEEMVENTGRRMLPNMAEVLSAHETRNSIVYNPDFKISQDQARNILSIYENTIKSVATS